MTMLKDLYIEELQDLWSANDQMSEVVAEMADKALDKKLADRLSSAKDGVLPSCFRQLVKLAQDRIMPPFQLYSRPRG